MAGEIAEASRYQHDTAGGLRWYGALVVLCAGVFASVSFFALARRSETERWRQQFRAEAAERVAAIARELDRHMLILDSLASFYAGSEQVTREQFGSFIRRLLKYDTQAEAFEWVPRIGASRKDAFERSMRREGFVGFHIRQWTAGGRLRPALRRDEYFPVCYVEPSDRLAGIMGFDIASEPIRSAALQRARDTGHKTATNKAIPVWEMHNQRCLYVVVPVYRKAAELTDVQDRRDALEGFIVGVFTTAGLIEGALEALAGNVTDVYVFDGSDGELICYRPDDEGTSGPPRYSRMPQDLAEDAFTGTVRAAGAQWDVLCAPSSVGLAAARTFWPWFVLFSGLALTGLVSAYLINGARSASRLALYARRLGESERKFRAVFENAGGAIFIADTQTGRILECNRQAEQLIGRKREQIVGMHQTELHPPDQAEKYSKKFQAHIRQGRTGDFEAQVQHKDGRKIPVWIAAHLVELPGRRVLIGLFVDISKLKQAQQHAEQIRRQQEAILQNIPDIAWLKDRDSRFIAVNEPFGRACGVDPKDLVGKTDYDIWPRELAEKYRSDDMEVMRTGRRKRVEEPLADKQGKMVWIETIKTPIFDENGQVIGTTGIARDITQRRGFEQQLAQAKQAAEREAAKLSAMIAGMEEGVVFADAQNVIVEVNDYFCRFVGKRREQIIGTRIEDCHTGQVLQRVLKQIERFRAEGDCGPLVIQRPIGRAEVVLRMQPIYCDGAYDGVLLNVIDVTELVSARRAAEAASRAKSQFLASMSHEIRTPLTSILGFAELVEGSLGCCRACPEHRDCPVRREAKENVETITRNGQHLMTLINDILDLSKIEAGKVELASRRCSVQQIVGYVASMMRLGAKKKGIDLSVSYDGPLPETILVDPDRLRQILVNLVGNAVKFTDQGGVEIHVQYVPDWRDQQAGVRISVLDTGPGMSRETVEKLGQPFTQADASVEGRYGGTGLGLAITKRLIELMGGQLSVDSEPGRGSTFTVTIPTGPVDGVRMIEQPTEVMQADPCGFQDVQAYDLSGMRILIAEDGPDNQRLLSAILKRSGAEPHVVASGRDAIQKAMSEPFDAILMDVQMPGMDGYKATRRLRRAGYTGPIIALTAYALSGDRAKCMRAGCDEYLSKPIDRASLLEILARYAPGGRDAVAKKDAEPNQEPRTEGPVKPVCSQYADDPDMAELVQQFVGRMPDRLGELRQALDSGSFERLRVLAHQLKGAGGSYGFSELTDVARRLEQAAKAADAEAAGLAIRELAVLCEAMLAGDTRNSVRGGEK